MSPRAWDTKAKIKHRTSLNQARNSGQTAVSLYPNTLKINPIKWDTTDSIFMSIERRIERNNISHDGATLSSHTKGTLIHVNAIKTTNQTNQGVS